MRRVLVAAGILLTFALGFILGAAAIHRPIPGAPIELPPPRKPWSPTDVLGLVASIGIRGLSGHLGRIPSVVAETDRTFALAVPDRRFKYHYVIVPKKDIHDAGQISTDDQAYLTDIFLMARHLAERDGMKSYRLYTNSGGFQTVGYLHFHMVGWRKWSDDR